MQRWSWVRISDPFAKVEMKMKKKRFRILRILGVILLLLLFLAGAAFLYYRLYFTPPSVSIKAPDDRTIVMTSGGQVRGYMADEIYTYHGIPYAQAAERFVPAEAVEPWEGILDTTAYGPTSPQSSFLGGSAGGGDSGDNNCQNLNLWTSGIGDGRKRPVMVWLHGGGMSSGSGNDASYDGTNLARSEDVVVVSVNHRLNVYGFLDLSEYGEKYRYSANAGIMDIVDALKWLQENVSSFGGDPDNITVFGQSGGGAKVLALMTSPYAEGYFHKGIVQSGATDTLGPVFTSQEASAFLTQRFLDELGISGEDIEMLQTIDNASLQEAAGNALAATAQEFEIPQAFGNGYSMEWEPVVDGDFIPTNPVTEDGFAAAGKNVPLLIGSNLNEWALLGRQTHEVTDEIREAFRKAYPNEKAGDAGNTDTLLRRPLLRIMRHKAMQNTANVYAYVFTCQAWPLGAYHGAEIPFVFHNSRREHQLEKTMSALWASFARNGVPSAEGIPDWEPYTPETGATMILDRESYLAFDHDRELLELLAPGYMYD